LAAAAIASTFNSNSINAVFGAGVPALFLTIHASQAARTLDIFWLALMTCAAILLMALRWTLSRWEGSILVGLYIIFVVVRLLTMRL
jgi:Ca2+/Na+ antiporter